ncbi:gliding motility-associated C-terminal domain-containing protein [Hymenobacter norwichensis]|uniref:T9SS type B sorting domain-containing protein n=1 Tax=Hymenobacter norwichensis TaxID=223903 RepID=UPI00146B67CB|nr:gliding motility-associated C-terminal domain-containing protein [Hymenobacter norwichensis]
MDDPVNQSFYVATSVVIDPGQGTNRSPILTRPAVDNAAVAEVFQHNPGAYDPDGDSLVFVLAPSRQAGRAIDVVGCTPTPAPVPGFRYPNDLLNGSNGSQVAFTGPPVGRPGDAPIFEMNRRTGQIVWNSPGTVGEYNFAFVVRSYRRTAFGYRLNDSVIRDMQIVVRPTTNRRPELSIPPDLCVVAGTPVSATVTATDPDANPITLSANSGILPPATFTQSSAGPPTARGTFQWTPDCNDIGVQPKLVVFNAVDQPAGGASGVALTDLRVWSITVIGPAPQNLRVRAGTGTPRTAILEWNSYLCRKPGAQIRIYRKEGTSGFSPGPCQTGIPASSGFVQIQALTYTGTTDITTFTDDNGGAGLDRGKEYCYRIYVEFPLPAGGQSIASNEACLNFTGRALVMRRVTVDRTAVSSGQITVEWTKPKSTPPFADPQQFRLSRAVGQTTTGPFTPIATLNVSTTGNDTTYVDQDPTLDTQNRSYSYRVEFLSQNQVQEIAPAASSVRVEGTAIPAVSITTRNAIVLNWTYTVPWNNALRPTIIYRKGPDALPTDPFVAIATVTGTATGGSYRDEGTASQPLRKGATYCYYVETNGTYNAQRLPDTLVNRSQQQCIAVRNIPCAPVLTLTRPNCDSLASRLFELPATPISGAVYTNNLRWTLGTTPADCSRAIRFYNIYYAPNDQDSLRFLTQVPATQTSYAHTNLRQEAGCYAVQAVDSSGTLSARSNVECKDDCQLFLLPNIFTPNGDGKNDTFRPKVFTPIRRTHFTAFNRWGVKIYESSADPLINWPGGGSRTEGSGGASVVEGMYFYQAEVEFGDVNNTKRTYKGWVQITR